MEAVPRLPMIGLELKTSSDAPNFAPKLKQYIAEFYREDPESYNAEIHQLEGLRSAAVRPSPDKAGCAALEKYFAQLRGLQSRFPMSKGQPAAVTFAWRDLFANVVCPLPDVRFEMVCVLYNIGALHSRLAAAEPRATQDGMRTACAHYQTAVWAFEHLRERYPQPAGVDLGPDATLLFRDLCLAQAQECILEKSVQDARKPAIVGAIGAQTLLHYRAALKALEPPPGAPDGVAETVGSKACQAWTKYVSFKIAYIRCVVHLFQGMQAEEQQRMGERVAHYQAAADCLKKARKLAKGMTPAEAIEEALQFTDDVVEGKRKAAKNENEFIYHEEVPDPETLPPPKPAPLAKGIPVDFADPEVSGPDVFGRLVPMRAHEASSMYSEEKAKLLRKTGSAVEIKDGLLNDFMSSLQLDELNILNDQERLPQELIDICASLSVKTDAIQKLVDSMNVLADIHTDVNSLFAEIKTFIEDEEKNEKEFQQIMGKRPPSNISTELTRETNKYFEAHNKANESNQTLHKAMTVHLSNLKLLSLPLDELQKHVPSIESIKNTVDNAAIKEMRTLVEKVNEMRAQRSMLVLQLREEVNNDDITSQLLTRTGESLDDIFKQEIEKHNKTAALIEQNMIAQDNILKALTDAYAKYAPSRKIISDVLRKREAFFTAMTTSYETYEDLMKKSLKGIEFYKKLHTTVSRQHSRLKSICKVQQEEREQLLASNMPKQVVNKPVANEASISYPSAVPPMPQKDDISSAPKLKDFLPYMKNRNTSQFPNESSAVDSSQVSQMYPPYVRPAPLGSEDSSTAAKSNYFVGQDGYKNYQSNPAMGTYNMYQYPEQNASSYTSGNYAGNYQNTAYPYQAYGDSVPSQSSELNVPENVNQNMGNSNVQQDASQHTKNATSNYSAAGYSSMVPNYPAVNYSVAEGYSYGNYAEANPASAQIGSSMQDAYGNPISYGNYQPSQDRSQDKLANQMQNMNLSYSMPTEGTVNSYSYSTASMNPASYDGVYSQSGMYPVSQTLPDIPAVLPQNSLNINPAHITSTINSMYSRSSFGQIPGTVDPNVAYQNPYVSNQIYGNEPATQTMKSDDGISSHATFPNQGYVYNNPTVVPNSNTPNETPVHIPNPQTNLPNAQPSEDLPIKSHVQQGFVSDVAPSSVGYPYQNTYYSSNEAVPQQFNQEVSNNSYAAHPGYGYNPKTGMYDYNYGYQHSSTDPYQYVSPDNSQQNLYTNAGTYGTTQTSSTPVGNEQTTMNGTMNQHYYSAPYGHQSSNYESPEVQFSNNNEQPNVPAEKSLTYINSNDTKTTTTYSNQAKASVSSSSSVEESTGTPEKPKEPSAIDLLSGLDFSIEQAPLMPEIKVPPVSECVIRKAPIKPAGESIVDEALNVPDVPTRPPKKDIFLDPSLLNKFTQEVKNLQQFVDGFTKKTHSGITMLDSKWKKIQETQMKENNVKTTNDAKKYPEKNVSQDVLAYDDSRVILKSDISESYVNASHLKQMSSWCIPLIISDLPSEGGCCDFWHMILQQKVSVMVCLLTEIELQGKFYGPTAKTVDLEFPSGLKVTLEDINCNVNWTERKLIIKHNKIEHKITHYQINVFPARVVSAPLVMLVDKVLNTPDENDLENMLPTTLIHCSSGAGRSSLIALLTMVMCQVRAGFIDLRDMLDSGILYLCGTRTNVLEDTKYLVDIYRTVLYYVQGVLCSGTVMFNGEAVSVPTGASIPPPPINQQSKRSENFGKFSKESFEEMKQAAGLKSGDMQDPLSYLDPLWSLKKRKD